jgi:membrane protein DedA with SNARE-associated domain
MIGLETMTALIAQHGLAFVAPVALLAVAGAGRMTLGRLPWFNLPGTVPKSLFFVALGYEFGAAYTGIDHWISRAPSVLAVLILVVGASWAFYGRAIN